MITKLKILFSFCCVIVLSLTIAVNIILAAYKGSINKTLSGNFFKPVSVGNIFYLPPNLIILKNLSISENITGPDKKILTIALSYASFSLSKLFLDKTFAVDSLSGTGLIANSSDLFSFLKDSFNQILDFITGLPKNDFRLSLRKIAFFPAQNNIYPLGAEGSLSLELKGRAISASGHAGKNAFSFKGLLSKGRVDVENFKLGNGDINCQFWGKLSSGLAEFKGFILKNNLGALKKPNAQKLFILDIDSRIKFTPNRVEIERLNFLLNDNPVKLTADILLTKPFTCNLKLFSDFRSMDNKNESRLKKITLLAEIISQQDKVIKVNGSLNIDFSEYNKESLPLEKLRINAKDLILNFEEPLALKISASALNLFSKTTANLYDLNLNDLNSKVYQYGKTLKTIKFSSRFYGGRLEGRANIEMKEFLPVISAVIRVKDVDANKLEGVLIYFSKVYGKLSSEMSFINYPQLIFKGTLHLRNGSLNNFEFLKWLADLFDLPSFKKIQFNTASADFIADKEGVGMSNMDLDSTNVKIKGSFRLKESDMVSSKIFLSLRREILQESPRFTPLLRLLDTKQELIKFNFQLSGNLHGMNFQWLKSDFKDDLQKAIPNFAKRGFEEKVDKIIESINKE